MNEWRRHDGRMMTFACINMKHDSSMIMIFGDGTSISQSEANFKE